MPTLAKTQEAIDAFVTNKWSTIVARQENYHTNHGRYWQGLKTHAACPEHSTNADGSKTADNFTATPSDNTDSWLNVFPEWMTESLPACIRIDTYGGPGGEGWVLHVEAKHNGVLYRRSVNVGPESYRSSPWQAIVPPPS